MEKVLRSHCLFKLLEAMDADLAVKARARGCRHCGEERLHKGDYERKPRGMGTMACWGTRYSYDCSRCRRRTTPASVRFLGRKVYLGVVVVVVGAMMHGATPSRVRQLRESLGIDRRTLEHWRAWWKRNFVGSGFWKQSRAAFMPILDESLIPASLVAPFGAERCSGMVSLLGFLAPITLSGGLEGRVM